MLEIIVPVNSNSIGKADIEDMEKFLLPYIRKGTNLNFETLKYGFGSIETELQGMFNGAQTVMRYIKVPADCRGVMVDCFDDPGVYACREIGSVPVVGPYQAAISTALNLAERIGVITTDKAGITNEEKKARELGIAGRIVSIRALDTSVDDIRANREEILEALVDTCTKMVNEDRVSAICLGCTAMFYIYEELQQKLAAAGVKVNIIEPFLNGVLALENMVIMGHSNFIPGTVDFSSLVWEQKE